MLQVLLYRGYRILGTVTELLLLKSLFLTHQLNYFLNLVTTNDVNWLGSFSIRVIQQHSLEVSLNSPGERTKNCI